MRAAIHILEDVMGANHDSSIYITEQITPQFTAIASRFGNTVGSEFITDGTTRGNVNSSGIRFEDVTQLRFPDRSFDHYLTFDVFEHVPDYRSALSEAYRVLKPSGSIMITVPFEFHAEKTITRAILREDNSIEHILKPEYHGDPLNNDGILAYYNFAWDFIQDIRDCGFENVNVIMYWSSVYGYLGALPFVIIGNKTAHHLPVQPLGSRNSSRPTWLQSAFNRLLENRRVSNSQSGDSM